MNFTPQQTEPTQVPYFEDAGRDEGWQGYRTTKSVKTLQTEISNCIARLGGIVSGFQRGMFQIGPQTREGFRILYTIQNPDSRMVPGRLDIAALPIKQDWNDDKKDKSLRMALYMLRTALEGMWFMQQLSPGYAPLMPWMLANPDQTISQLWAESPIMSRLLPPPESDFVDAVVIERR